MQLWDLAKCDILSSTFSLVLQPLSVPEDHKKKVSNCFLVSATQGGREGRKEGRKGEKEGEGVCHRKGVGA